MAKIVPGEYYSLKGEAHSKVKAITAPDIVFGMVTVENGFGMQSKIDARKLVPYGAGTGPEKPLGGRMQPGTGVRRNY